MPTCAKNRCGSSRWRAASSRRSVRPPSSQGEETLFHALLFLFSPTNGEFMARGTQRAVFAGGPAGLRSLRNMARVCLPELSPWLSQPRKLLGHLLAKSAIFLKMLRGCRSRKGHSKRFHTQTNSTGTLSLLPSSSHRPLL